ncbi:MAG: peptide ABC transporter substrate-binding protein [Clostridiales bacterium]|nr:peptide ABC transporter substrate-binding protein [Clostridiales bacterium]
MGKITGVLLAVALAVLCCPLSGCHRDTPADKSFRFRLPADPQQLDPQVSTDRSSMTVTAALFEGLTRLDNEGRAVPAAADWTVSADGLIYTFTLKESLWSNGEPVTAADFAFGIRRAVQPSTRSTLAVQLYDIAGAEEVNAGAADLSALQVEARDERTLVITLKEPNASFPEKAAATPFLPCNEAIFESTGGRYGMEKEYVLCNGPFYLKRWSHGEYLVIERQEGYHDRESILPAAVRYVVGAESDPLTALSEGNLDAAELPPELADAARQEKLQLIPLQDTIRYLFFNNGEKALAQTAVRQALCGALEWGSLRGLAVEGGLTPAEGFAAPEAVIAGAQTYRTADNACLYASDSGARGRLAGGLSAAGLTAMPSLTVLCADDEFSQNVTRYILQSWQRNLSLYFTMKPLPEAELEARVRVGNYQIALCPSQAGGLTALEAFGEFHSASSSNLARFSDPDYDALYTAARTGSVTRETLEALEQKLMELCPSVPLYFQTRYFALPERVSGMVIHPFGGGSFGSEIDFRAAGKRD